MNEVAGLAEERCTKRLLKAAAELGKILHPRGGHVKIQITLSGRKTKKATK